MRIPADFSEINVTISDLPQEMGDYRSFKIVTTKTEKTRVDMSSIDMLTEIIKHFEKFADTIIINGKEHLYIKGENKNETKSKRN